MNQTDNYSQGSSPIDVGPDVSDSAIVDPPPPYPDPLRRHHRKQRSHCGASGSHGHGRVQSHTPSTEFHSDALEEDDDSETTENTPFLLSNRGPSSRHSRQRSFSHGSTSTSGITSLTQTVISLFHGDDEDSIHVHCGGDCADGHRHQSRNGGVSVDDSHSSLVTSANCCEDFSCSVGWKRYFVPLRRRVYYRALFHLLVLNFPYALIAWIYLFVFTVVSHLLSFCFHTDLFVSQTGTTTLIALPLGAILCFLDLLGARAFSRGELYLQTRFHQVYLPSYQPRPLFTRLREPPIDDYESGGASCNVGNPTRFRRVKEHSFYKNTYAMVRPYAIYFRFLIQEFP